MGSPTDQHSISQPSAANRSKVTNGSRVILFGDGRSAGARRLRDLIARLAGELGGIETLAESEIQIVRRAASTAVAVEALEALQASGGTVSSADFTAACNVSRRALKDFEALRKARAGKTKGPGLRDYLAQKSTQHAPEAA